MSLVSVVIPNYNYARYVPAAIESVLGQSRPPGLEVEVVVVDNGSTDDSLQVLQAYAGRIRIIAQENRGQSGARNRGIAESTGQFVAFCDADDAWQPLKLERQLEKMNRPEVGLVYTGYEEADSRLRPLRAVMPAQRGHLLRRFAESAAAVIPGGESTVLIRRECLEQVGVFDPALSISAGFDLYRRIAAAYEVEVVSEPLMLYRQHGGNASRNVDAYARDWLRAIEKMFTDPASSEVWGLRARSYGKVYLSLSGAYWQARRPGPSLAYLGRSLLQSPQSAIDGAIYVAQFPLRAVTRARATRVTRVKGA